MTKREKPEPAGKIDPKVMGKDYISDPRSKVLLRKKYPNQPFLLNYGPLISAIISVPQALEEQFKAEGLEVPKPLEGFLLIDTGATCTMIAEHSVKELGIKPITTLPTIGIHGKNDVFAYPITITIPTDKGQFSMTEVVAGVNLKEAFEELEALLKRKILGLLGRDFLVNAKLIIDVYNSEVVLVRNDSRIKILDIDE